MNSKSTRSVNMRLSSALRKHNKKRGKKIRTPGTPEHNIFKTQRAPRPVLVTPPSIKKNTIPKIHSFLRPPQETASDLERKAMEWILEDLLTIVYEENSIVPIVPYSNPARMNHQTPQAMRLFFSAAEKKSGAENAESPVAFAPKTQDFAKIPKKKRPPMAVAPKTELIVESFKNEASQKHSPQIVGKSPRKLSHHHKNKRKKRLEKMPIRKTSKAKKATIKTNKNTEDDDTTERLYCYGFMAVMNTTGFHPSNDIKVRPFCEKLKTIVALLTEEVRKHLKPNSKHHTNDLDFNHLEVKIYHGKDIYRDDKGKLLKDDKGNEIRDDCNKMVNLHNDLCFSDQGIQNPSDTARGDHPIATLTIGATRKLTFFHKWKASSSWKKGKKVTFDLDQGSIFVLLPDDEIPKSVQNKLHKTQHLAKFSGEGISIALVFRSVKTTTVFDKRTHQWLWKKDSFYRNHVRKYLRKNSMRHDIEPPKKGSVPKEVKGMMNNVSRFLNRLKLGGRFRANNNKKRNQNRC